MKRVELLTYINEVTYKLVKELCVPNKPSKKTYDELVKFLLKHLKPGPSELLERCKFNRANQEANELVADFATRLRYLSSNCNFGSTWEKSMHVQFTMGIRVESTRFEFFKNKNLTFESVLEEVAKNSLGAAQTLASKSRDQDKQYRGQTKSSEKQQKNEQPKSELKCYCCGKSGYDTCKYQDRKCDFCHKKGHQ